MWCISERRWGTRKGVMKCSISHRQMTLTLSSVLSTMTWPGKQLSDRKTWWHQHKQPKFPEVPTALIWMPPQDSELVCHCSFTAVNLLRNHGTPLNKVHEFTGKTYLENKALEIASEQFSLCCNLWSVLPGSLSRTGWELVKLLLLLFIFLSKMAHSEDKFHWKFITKIQANTL